MTILNPLDFFRNANGVPEHFDGEKQVNFLDWDANPPQFSTQLIPPPASGPAFSSSILPLEGEKAVAIKFYWKFVGGRTVPCNGSAQEITKTYRKSLQAELSVEIQRELEQKLEVDGVGGISNKVTATIGMTFTASYEAITEEKVTINPPASGSITKEFYQPIVVLRLITPGKVYEMENGLSHILERTEISAEPVCGAQPGHGYYKPGTDLMEGVALAEMPGVDSEAIALLKSVGIVSPLGLAAARKEKLVVAGIGEAEAKAMIKKALDRVGEDIKKIYPAG